MGWRDAPRMNVTSILDLDVDTDLLERGWWSFTENQRVS